MGLSRYAFTGMLSNVQIRPLSLAPRACIEFGKHASNLKEEPFRPHVCACMRLPGLYQMHAGGRALGISEFLVSVLRMSGRVNALLVGACDNDLKLGGPGFAGRFSKSHTSNIIKAI